MEFQCPAGMDLIHKGYYANIEHHVLSGLVERFVPDRAVLRLIWGYLRRTVCFGENYREVQQGISLGCSLSPLMGALYLNPLDRAMEDSGFFYARFMDDWLILAPTRWKLRNAVRAVRQVLHALKLEMHPDKTFIGRADRGVDFLGYHFELGKLTVSSAAIQRFTERICRLYEQGATHVRVGRYVQRWIQWVSAGLNRIVPANDEIRSIGSVGTYNGAVWCGLR